MNPLASLNPVTDPLRPLPLLKPPPLEIPSPVPHPSGTAIPSLDTACGQASRARSTRATTSEVPSVRSKANLPASASPASPPQAFPAVALATAALPLSHRRCIVRPPRDRRSGASSPAGVLARITRPMDPGSGLPEKNLGGHLPPSSERHQVRRAHARSNPSI